MHLLRAQSLGLVADDPDTFPRRGVYGGHPCYQSLLPRWWEAGLSSHAMHQLLMSGAHSAEGALRSAGQSGGAHFLSQHRLGVGEDRRGQGTDFTGQQV